MITCFIIDDNDLSRLTLHQLALQTGSLQVTGECKDAIEAHRNITANPPDLVLLDVEMPGMTGIELLKILPKDTLAILTTSQKQYAARTQCTRELCIKRFLCFSSKVDHDISADNQIKAPVKWVCEHVLLFETNIFLQTLLHIVRS